MPTPEVSQRIRDRLQELYERHLPVTDGVARYYASGYGYYGPERAGEEQDQFAISLVTVDGDVHEVGDEQLSFPLQSLSKVFTYALALADHGPETVLRRVGVEPSGDEFSSITFDVRHNRPYNPMVNAGALVTSSLVTGRNTGEQLDRILTCLADFAGHSRLTVDQDIFSREMDTRDHNRATAYLMRSLGMLHGDVESILALYLRQCSVRVTCRDLAVMAATLANGYVNPLSRQRALPRNRVRDVLSVMYTCGMYNYAGQWAFEVGVPAKSGVSGGILAVIPGKMGIGVFSPGLDPQGNSVRGIRVCEEIADRLGLHVFATEAEDLMLRTTGGS